MDAYQTRTESLVQELRAKFDSMKKYELVEFLARVIEAHPEIGEEILEQEQAKSGEVEGIIDTVRSDIEDLCGEPDWDEYHRRDPYGITAPDFSAIHKRLELLVEKRRRTQMVQTHDIASS